MFLGTNCCSYFVVIKYCTRIAVSHEEHFVLIIIIIIVVVVVVVVVVENSVFLVCRICLPEMFLI
jgi:uncharacterized membrane protein